MNIALDLSKGQLSKLRNGHGIRINPTMFGSGVVNGSIKEGSSSVLYSSIISPKALCAELVLLYNTIA